MLRITRKDISASQEGHQRQDDEGHGEDRADDADGRELRRFSGFALFARPTVTEFEQFVQCHAGRLQVAYRGIVVAAQRVYRAGHGRPVGDRREAADLLHDAGIGRVVQVPRFLERRPQLGFFRLLRQLRVEVVKVQRLAVGLLLVLQRHAKESPGLLGRAFQVGTAVVQTEIPGTGQLRLVDRNQLGVAQSHQGIDCGHALAHIVERIAEANDARPSGGAHQRQGQQREQGQRQEFGPYGNVAHVVSLFFYRCRYGFR